MTSTVSFRRVAAASALLGVAMSPAGRVGAQLPQSVLDQDARMAQLAVEAAQRGPAAPIPLVGESGRPIGALYDQFVLGALLARQRVGDGSTPDPTAIQQHPLWRSRQAVVVAYPIDCDGKPNQPLAIRGTMPRSMPVVPEQIGAAVRGDAAQAMLPGAGLPGDALVASFRNLPPINAAIEIDYAGPVCHGAAKTASLPINVSPGIGLATAFNGIKLPDAHAALPSPTTVHVRVMLDPAGKARFPEPLDGPPELGALALEMLNARTFPPATTNGVPMPMNMIVGFVFTKNGERATPEPYRPAPVNIPGVMTTTSTVTTRSPAATPAPAPVVPPPAPGLLDTQIARLAIELARDGDPAPVPLDAAGPPEHGVIFDRFLVAAVKARAAAVAGKPLDPVAATPDLVREDAIVVAYPLSCSGRSIAPSDVEMSVGGARPGPVPDVGPLIAGAALGARLPGVRLPDGAVGKAFASAPFQQNLEVRVTYASPPCGATTNALTLPIQWLRGQPVRRPPTAKLPDGSAESSPSVVQLRGMVDAAGAYRFPSLAAGSASLAAASIQEASRWQYQPYRANGVAIPQSVITTLTFTATGAPEPALAAGSVPPPAFVSGAPPQIAASSTVNGRPAEIETPDVAGLSAATSRCAIADDASYGLTPARAIQVGGGPMEGPAREKKYLGALRGPEGQGIRARRLGSLPGPDGQTILDAYEITYAGLTAPLRLYLDEYHDGTLQAPKGLVCASAIVVR
jgi:hypothetical protein